jgi:hypothetical protein
MRQAGQSKKMAEARLSFEERKTITILIQFFPFFGILYIYILLLRMGEIAYLIVLTSAYRSILF